MRLDCAMTEGPNDERLPKGTHLRGLASSAALQPQTALSKQALSLVVPTPAMGRGRRGERGRSRRLGGGNSPVVVPPPSIFGTLAGHAFEHELLSIVSCRV